MEKSTGRPLSTEILFDEVRFLLKTLLRDDLFGEEVSLTEAEKLLENSLSLGFVEYCAFLKRQGFVKIDRSKNTIYVQEAGKRVVREAHDPNLISALSAHFSGRLEVAHRDSEAHISEEAVAEEMIGERYIRFEAIGQGSLGTVYRAKNLVLGREVALKQFKHVYEFFSYLPHDALTARLREMLLKQARLDHPNILSVVDLDFDVEYPHVILKQANGGSLRERMYRAHEEENGLLPIEMTIRLVVQVAHALEYAHRHDVIHGGLKPENILFDHMGNAQVSDFGAVFVTEKEEGSGVPVYVGSGTPSYMAPEQLHGNNPGPASDIYALGILLYQLLTGELPGRRSPMPSEVNPKIPAAVDEIFDKMTQDALSQRYASVSELMTDLEKVGMFGVEHSSKCLFLYHEDSFAPPNSDPLEVTIPGKATPRNGAQGASPKADGSSTAD